VQVEADPDTLGVLLLAMGLESVIADPANPAPLAVTTTLSQALRAKAERLAMTGETSLP
jgi:hypothetical protein